MYRTDIDIASWTAAPLQLTLAAVLQTGPVEAFLALTDPDRMCNIFAWMERVTLSRPVPPSRSPAAAGGVGVLRTCRLGSGLVLEEEIIGWQPPRGYAYRGIEETHPFGMRGHVGVFSFESSAGSCRLLWEHYFDHSNVPAMRAQLQQSMEAAVEALLRQFGGRLQRITYPPIV